MKKNVQTLRHLSQFKLLISEQIHLERLYRNSLRKKKPDNLDEMYLDSVAYQRFLEKLLQEVFEDITL